MIFGEERVFLEKECTLKKKTKNWTFKFGEVCSCIIISF